MTAHLHAIERTLIQDYARALMWWTIAASQGHETARENRDIIEKKMSKFDTHRLVDEYRIWTFPIVLGTGKRLFGEGSIPVNLELQRSEALSSGATMSVYRNAF